jgi:two-component system heavy metal sensor histidine kinase CusS
LADQPTELEPVIRELNGLLERIEKTLLRERTLTSNVAHELRTPISGLLCTLEVTLNRLRSPQEYYESATECFEIAKRLNWLVNNLLSVARIETGNVPLQMDELTLGDSLMEWWRPFAARASERGLRVDWAIDRSATITTDTEFFRVIITNLFDNAVSYAPEGGMVRVEAHSDGGLSVTNNAVALTDDMVQHVFDPFWRRSESRDGEVAHAGLGLSLSRKIMDLLGGRISAQIKQPGNWFVVRLEWLARSS